MSENLTDQAPKTPLADHIIAFGRVLRRAGLELGSDQIMDAIRAVDVIGIRRRDDVYQALYSVFVQRREHIDLFDQAFQMFWRAPDRLPDEMAKLLPKTNVPPPARPPGASRVQEALEEPDKKHPPLTPKEPEEEPTKVEVVATYSSTEVLREKDFTDFTSDEVEAAKAMIERMRWPIDAQPTRRRSPRAKGTLLDLRQTIRQSLRHHGEMLELRRRGPKQKPRPLVVLCDISGSMERYSRMLLHFMHAITEGMRRVESFVFGTRLTWITRHLRQRDIDDAVTTVSEHVHDWEGGTRIGEALKAFNYTWLRRVLPSTGVVLIISDGCDRGDVDLLEREVARLSRSCYRLIWLNPLLGYEDYEPLTRGIRAVLPHVDDFLPVHNLASLEQLGEVMSNLTSQPTPSWRTMYRWQL